MSRTAGSTGSKYWEQIGRRLAFGRDASLTIFVLRDRSDDVVLARSYRPVDREQKFLLPPSMRSMLTTFINT
jgi:hypothetical protein